MLTPEHFLDFMRAGVMLAGTTLMWSIQAPPADRLTDRDVKALVARIEEGRDRFDDALDDKLKHGVVRSARGEVKVDDFLNDFQESIDRLEERLKPDYAGSAEVAAVLRQASSIERFFRQEPPGTRGESEWNRLATDLKALASAYGTQFPLPSDTAPVRRVGDRELSNAIDQVAKSTSQLKQRLDTDLKKDTATDPSMRQAVVSDADQLSKDAKALKSRVKDGKPSSAEAERLLAGASKMQTFIDSHQLPTASGPWGEASGHLQTIAHAYGRPSSGAR